MSPLIDILILLDQRSVIYQVLFSEGFSDENIRKRYNSGRALR